MANNSSPTLYLNLESVAPESAGAALGPVVTAVIGEFATTSIGPTTVTLITAASEALGPVIQEDINLLGGNIHRPSPSGNILMRCDSAIMRVNTFEFDIDSIVSPPDAPYEILGVVDGFSALSEETSIESNNSNATYINSASGIRVILPANPASGLTYTFKRTEGPFYISPTGDAAIWNNETQTDRSSSVSLLLDSQDACITLMASSTQRWIPIHEHGSITGLTL